MVCLVWPLGTTCLDLGRGARFLSGLGWACGLGVEGDLGKGTGVSFCCVLCWGEGCGESGTGFLLGFGGCGC